MKKPNLQDYPSFYRDFDWEIAAQKLEGLPGAQGLNIAHEAVDRHGLGVHKDTIALKFIRKDGRREAYSYGHLYGLTSKFAHVLKVLGIKEGETVFSLLGRVPELYIAALGSLKAKAVFCPLFSVFGPEPILQRLGKGEAKVLVTNRQFFEQKVKGLMDALPQLQHVLLTDIHEDIDAKVKSFPRLMQEASDTFTIPPTDMETPALLHFTSGTTGLPKGAIHVH